MTLRRVGVVLIATHLLIAGRTASADSITIWWAQWDPAAALQTLSKEFTEDTGTSVVVHQIPWPSYHDQVFLNFGNKQTDFDIVVGDSQWIGRGAQSGLYLDLTDWLPKAVDMDSVHPLARRYLCEYPYDSGRYYAAPCETDAIGFAYRRDWFEDPEEKEDFKARHNRELAPPDTWQEFREVAAFFHRPEEKQYGCSILAGRGYDGITMGFQPFLWAWGGAWGNRTTYQIKGYVNGTPAIQGLTFMKTLLPFTPPGGNSADYFYNNDVFLNGSTAMVLDYFPFYPGIVNSMGDKVGFFVVPRNGDRRAISLGGQGFSISTKIKSSQQQRAKEFIAWFHKKEIQKKWITYPGAFTANTELLSSKEFVDASPYNHAFAASLDHLRDFWNVPVYNELLAVSQRYLGEALDDVKTPKEALDIIAEEHELIMMQAGLLK